MSADTFVSALFIITAVVAAGILINAVYPIVWSTASTFSTTAHDTDTRMRTDFKIVTTFAPKTGDPSIAKIWMKNIGSSSIGTSDLENADVFIGIPGNFYRVGWDSKPITNPPATPLQGYWDGSLLETAPGNGQWDPGETLEIQAYPQNTDVVFTSGNPVYFQFVLPNGVYRSVEFTASNV